jgi:hypothetical protein
MYLTVINLMTFKWILTCIQTNSKYTLLHVHSSSIASKVPIEHVQQFLNLNLLHTIQEMFLPSQCQHCLQCSTSDPAMFGCS